MGFCFSYPRIESYEVDMDSCIANSHQVEWIEEASGLTWWHCVTCNVNHPVYTDGIGG